MSFVGPRALMPGEIETSGDGRVVAIEDVDGYRERTAVQPGLTGLRRSTRRATCAAAQVPLRSALRQAPVFLAGHPADTAVVLDQHARHVGASSAEVLADSCSGGWRGPRGSLSRPARAAQWRRTLSVLVLEEHDSDRRPGALHRRPRPRRLHEFALPRDTICTITRAARFYGRHGRSVRVDGGEVAAAVVDRGRFDRALAGSRRRGRSGDRPRRPGRRTFAWLPTA